MSSVNSVVPELMGDDVGVVWECSCTGITSVNVLWSAGATDVEFGSLTYVAVSDVLKCCPVAMSYGVDVKWVACSHDSDC